MMQSVTAGNSDSSRLRLVRHTAPRRGVSAEIDKLLRVEAALLRLRFGVRQPPRTTAETAAVMGCSAAAVRRLEHSALRKLRWFALATNGGNESDET